MKRITIATLSLAACLVACESAKPEPSSQPAGPGPTDTVPPMKGGPNGPTLKPGTKPIAKPAAGGLAWKQPEGWTDGGQKPMRLATFKVPAAEGDADAVEVSISRAMGSVEANVTRWRGQFKDSPEAKVEEKEIAGIKTTMVEIEGTWIAGSGRPMGGGGEPKEGWKMVVAMMHTEGSAHFFKMWGPTKTLDAARSDFDGLLSSVSQK